MRKIPKELDHPDKMEMWLRFLRAESQEELDKVKEAGGKEMSEAVAEYNLIAGSPEYRELERRRRIARIDEKLIRMGERKEGEKRIIDLLKSGVSPDEIIKNYEAGKYSD